MRTLHLVLTFLAFAASARAQALVSPATTPSDSPTTNGTAPTISVTMTSPIFKSGVDLVALNVVVTDQRQKFVNGLGAVNFAIFEDGVQQEVSYFAATAVPLDLALLLDTSASMFEKMKTMQEAAIGFASTLRQGDRVTIVDIKDNVRVVHPLDGDFEGAKQAIRTTVARGGTALFNALYLTLKDMTKQRRVNDDVRRRAIAVLTDGDDTASLIGYDDVMDLAKQAGIAIYTITLKSEHVANQSTVPGRRYFSQSEFGMKELAQETGARAFFPLQITELAGVYGSIAEELANQYAIGYTSRNPRRDGGYRRVIVQVPERPDLRTRTRSGYTAARVERAANP